MLASERPQKLEPRLSRVAWRPEAALPPGRVILALGVKSLVVFVAFLSLEASPALKPDVSTPGEELRAAECTPRFAF